MIRAVRIFVEGGGPRHEAKRQLRVGFTKFLRDLHDNVRLRELDWDIQVCGPRRAAYEAFAHAVARDARAFCVLLVDAEGPVNKDPHAHLHRRDGWKLSQRLADNCHLMVQVMESWFVADPEALSSVFGRGFRAAALPSASNIETVGKSDIFRKLEAATRHSGRGAYEKGRDMRAILQKLDANRVRARAPHCQRLFETLNRRIANGS